MLEVLTVEARADPLIWTDFSVQALSLMPQEKHRS